MASLNENQRLAIQALKMACGDAMLTVERDWRRKYVEIAPGGQRFRIDALVLFGAVRVCTVRQGRFTLRTYQAVA